MNRVSIPKRVTAKVEHLEPVTGNLNEAFQSLKGLQPKWNQWRDRDSSSSSVSIPKRVTAKVERRSEDDR